MHQDRFACFHGVGVFDEGEGRERLEEGGAGVGRRDGGWDGDGARGGRGAVFGVGAAGAHPDDAVVELEGRGCGGGAEGGEGAFAFAAGDSG